jgi:hypothetical protein
MNPRIRKTDGIDISISLSLSEPVRGIAILRALFAIVPADEKIIIVPQSDGIMLGGSDGYSIGDYAIVSASGNFIHLDKGYETIIFTHCNWPIMHFGMGYSDPEGAVLNTLKAVREKFEEQLQPQEIK